MAFAFPATVAPQIRSIVRIIAGLMFMLHGTQKLLGFPDPGAKLTPEAPALLKAAGMIELVGGALIAVGLFTSIAAFIASGEMAVAYFKHHAPGGFWPTLNGGEVAVLYCFVFLYLAFAGPGPWSIDAMIGRGRARRA
ncbi:MAG TPA: DoxX family protein [Thermoanaerobaculia bacterium]|nr:DoxX family protein [Thermoanaerobaculia bacterium]